MNTLITSDLHYGITSKSKILNFVRQISQNPLRPDVIGIAGDIAEVIQDPELFRLCLKIWRQAFDVPILVVAGNHDLWVYREHLHDRNSLKLWNEILPKMTREEGCIWLEDENWVQDGVAIVGSMLHYDYSAIDKVGVCAGLQPEYFIVNKKKFTNDGKFLHGLPPDIEFAKQIGDAFLKRLQDAQNDPRINSIVVMTHVPCLEQQITRNPYDRDWAMSTPFFGNLSHQEAITRCPKVKYVVSGHSHRGNESVINRGQNHELRVWNLDSDYDNPTYKIFEL